MIENVFSPAEAAAHPQLLARDYWQEVKHDELGISLSYPSSFCRFSENICKVWRRAPLIGEHNQEIYCGELGYSAEEIIALKQNGVI
jgi:crotonobetainyl-CoA:carnitine CoA-transferase CaiB-like acyl-CoA transferase